MSIKSLIINPGSTSTKIGVFEDETLLFEETLRHSTEEISQYASIVDQKDFRKKIITDLLAEKNFEKNNINTIKLEFGDLFEPVKDKKFDVILFNTPYLPTEEEDIIDSDLNYAFDGGSDGRKIIDRFLNEVKNHLNEGGCVQIIQSSLSNTEQTLVKLDQLGFIAEVAKSEKFFFEEIVLINAYMI